ncbi:unnamed protein product, partial [Closterium sp. NIES-54]
CRSHPPAFIRVPPSHPRCSPRTHLPNPPLPPPPTHPFPPPSSRTCATRCRPPRRSPGTRATPASPPFVSPQHIIPFSPSPPHPCRSPHSSLPPVQGRALQGADCQGGFLGPELLLPPHGPPPPHAPRLQERGNRGSGGPRGRRRGRGRGRRWGRRESGGGGESGSGGAGEGDFARDKRERCAGGGAGDDGGVWGRQDDVPERAGGAVQAGQHGGDGHLQRHALQQGAQEKV